MPYRLSYTFDPDYEHRRLRPRNRNDGSVDQYDLGYVQNVVAGQTLAEWTPLAPDAPPDPTAVVAATPIFSHGEGCRVDPADQLRLLATRNGHVTCADGKIVVYDTVTIHQDIDFHTGNIVAVSDVLIDGNIRSGFLVMGRNLSVGGTVEAARLKAMGSITCQAGIMGGGTGALRAGRSLRAKFCEKSTLHAADNILIDGSSMHCRLFAGKKLAVKGRLVGGEVYCGEAVYVGEQLGGGGQSQTRLLVGYDPELIHKDQHLKASVREALLEIEACQAEMGRGGSRSRTCTEELSQYEALLETRRKQLWRLWSQPSAMHPFGDCRVIVPGRIGANVEISIGEASLTVPEDVHDVVFRYREGEIIMEHPALRK